MADLSQKTGCFGLLARLFGKGVKAPVATEEWLPTEGPLPYGKRDHFLSAAEISFYHVLKGVTGNDRSILCKVRLADLFYVKRPHENRGAMNKIDRKHIDFVICRADTMDPILGIELDDRSHDRADRRDRDELVDSIFEAAGLPLLHISAAKGYVPDEIAAKIAAAIG